ncbi:MAG: phenylalanine--tRNA ligase subunit beta [Candidatus Anstonellaceae archaeon]
MAQVQFPFQDLQELVSIGQQEALETLWMLGFPAEVLPDGTIGVEVTPNRPDCLCIEGLARTLQCFKQGNPVEFKVSKATISAICDSSVSAVRPAFGCAVVRNIKMTDSLLRSIMQLQEKLHETIGRKRRKVAIGLHDLAPIKPPFKYFACGREEISFVPLNSTEEVTPAEILKKHEKGIMYAHLVGEKCPMIVDAEGKVLSFPPIINGELTRVCERTREIFVDCTGTSAEAVKVAVNIVCAAFAQRGAQIEEVILDGQPYRLLEEKEWKLPTKEAQRLLGISLSDAQAAQLLSKMGHKVKGDRVLVPGYRADIMSEVDLIEDIAIAYGFNNFEPVLPEVSTVGKIQNESSYHDVMVGLGYTEALTWMLSNPALVKKAKIDEKLLEIENPLTEEYSVFRPAILPNLLSVLSEGKNERLPIRLYEIGPVAKPNLKQHLCIVSMHAKASFSEIKGVVLAAMQKLGKNVQIQQDSSPTYISGRCAAVYVGEKKIGLFGEIAPQVLVDFGLEQPVCAAEIEVEDV